MKKLLFVFAMSFAMMACNGNSTDSNTDTVDSVDTVVVDSVDSI